MEVNCRFVCIDFSLKINVMLNADFVSSWMGTLQRKQADKVPLVKIKLHFSHSYHLCVYVVFVYNLLRLFVFDGVPFFNFVDNNQLSPYFTLPRSS